MTEPDIEHPDYEVAREELQAFADRLGLTVESTFVPYSQSRNAKPGPGREKPWPSLNWRVRLVGPESRHTTPPTRPLILETDYSAGIGHTPAMKARAASYAARRGPYSESVNRDKLAAWEIENGKAGRFFMSDTISGTGKPLEPDAMDVLSSLLSDSDVLDAGGFEEWASNFGYDTDSRSAESTYRACLEIALKLRAAIGDAELSAGREIAGRF